MWHEVRLPGSELECAVELAAITHAIGDHIGTVYAEIRADSVGQSDWMQVECFSRTQKDGSEVLYFNDVALRLYRNAGGTRPVTAMMAERPPQHLPEGSEVALVEGSWLVEL